MSGRGSNKKPSDSQAVAAEAAKRAEKRPNRNTNNLNEKRLAGEPDPSAIAEMEKHRVDNIFWSSFDTRLLAAWLSDYPDNTLPAAKMNERDALISYLVTNGADRPRGKTATSHLKHMREIFKKHHPSWKGPMPGSAAPEITRSLDDDDPMPQQPESEAGGDPDDIDMTQGQFAPQSPPAARKELQFGSAQSVKTSAHQPSSNQLMSALKSTAGGSAHSAPITPASNGIARCATCLTYAADPTSIAWMCALCNSAAE
jgi:hypothetical protein